MTSGSSVKVDGSAAHRGRGQWWSGRSASDRLVVRPRCRDAISHTLAAVDRTLGRFPAAADTQSPPVRVWRDWLLFAVVGGATVAEAVVRDHMTWRAVAV